MLYLTLFVIIFITVAVAPDDLFDEDDLFDNDENYNIELVGTDIRISIEVLEVLKYIIS